MSVYHHFKIVFSLYCFCFGLYQQAQAEELFSLDPSDTQPISRNDHNYSRSQVAESIDSLSSLNSSSSQCSLPGSSPLDGIEQPAFCSIDKKDAEKKDVLIYSGTLRELSETMPTVRKILEDKMGEKEVEEVLDRAAVVSLGLPPVEPGAKPRDPRDFTRSRNLKNGEARLGFKISNDDAIMVSALVASDDQAFTSGMNFKFEKNLDNTLKTKGVDLILDFDFNLYTQGLGSTTVTDSGAKLRDQKWIERNTGGIGLRRTILNEAGQSGKYYQGMIGAVEINGSKKRSSWPFQSATQEDWHDLLNDTLGEGTARTYNNIDVPGAYDLGGFLNVGAGAFVTALVQGCDCQLEFHGDAALQLETNGRKNISLGVGSVLRKKFDKSVQGIGIGFTQAAHNRVLSNPARIREPGIYDYFFTNSDFESRVGLTYQGSISHTYERGRWAVENKLTFSQGERDNSGLFDSSDDMVWSLDVSRRTGGTKPVSPMIKDLNRRLASKGVITPATAVVLEIAPE